jgi:serine/threonine protein kinase
LARRDAVGAGSAPSLAEVVGTAGALPEDAVLWIAAGLAGALAVLHQAGRAHGDVRPGNVLLTRGGPRLTGDAPGRDGGAPVPAADMVALGMLLVAAYTGVSNRRPDLDNLPVRLRQVVAVCLAEDPEERATPAQLLDVIRALEPEAPVWTVEVDDLITPADTAPPSDTPVEAPPRPEPHGLSGARLALVVVAAVLVGVVVTALLFLVPGRDGGTRTADAPVTSRPTRLQPTEDDTPQQRTSPQQEPSKEQTPSTDPTSQAPPAPSPQRTRQTGTIDDCSGKPLTKPVSLLLLCGDGGAMLHDLIWTDWGSATATAQGVVSEVVCQPSCADGREVTSAATVVVSGLAGGRYTLMEIRAPQSPTNPDAHFTLDRLGPTYRD